MSVIIEICVAIAITLLFLALLCIAVFIKRPSKIDDDVIIDDPTKRPEGYLSAKENDEWKHSEKW